MTVSVKLSRWHTPCLSKCTANEQDMMDLIKLDNEENVTTHELLEEAMRRKAIEHRAEGYRQDNNKERMFVLTLH